MLIPSARARLLSNYQSSLFNSAHPREDRLYVFYLLIRPNLSWLKKILISYGLEANEAESELFLFADKLFRNFDPKKSSIVPYIEKYLPWKAEHLLRQFKEKENIETLTLEYIEPLEEYYWDEIDILLEERYIGKVFTRGEKYIISKILELDNPTQVDIATQLGVDRNTVAKYISNIREVLNEHWRNECHYQKA